MNKLSKLNDIINALQGMPISEFSDRKAYAKLRAVVSSRDQEWFRSDEYHREIAERNKVEERKRKEEAARKVARAKQVQQWLDSGELKKGTFLKVTGARDGSGIRELLEVHNGRLVCRQWLAADKHYMRMFDKGTDPKAFRYELKHGMWMQRQDQITTHDFNKVVKILKG